MALSKYVNTLGQHLLACHGERVHKLAVNAGFTCPNRDGTVGHGGCTFCNNGSFSPNAKQPPSVAEQLAAGRAVLARRTGARRFLAYFQAYTNTHAEVDVLRERFDAALDQPGVIGLSIGTRPDCVPSPVLDLLSGYRGRGFDVWLELGLQSAFDETLRRVNRGHGLASYEQAVRAARGRQIPVCTHLIAGLPGEDGSHLMRSHERVLELGVDGLKLHPLHVVRGTRLAKDWAAGEYRPLELEEYVALAADIVERTPADVVFHRLTGTASLDLLLAPMWCNKKWAVLNGIARELQRRGTTQGSTSTRLEATA